MCNYATHFFPWSGYFNLIYNSDIFVFLNDTIFKKRSWHNRNFIIVNNANLLTVPTKKSSISTTIMNKLIDNSTSWQKTC